MFSLQEIIEIVITILVVGYLFMDFARKPKLEFWEEEDRKKLFLNSCFLKIIFLQSAPRLIHLQEK